MAKKQSKKLVRIVGKVTKKIAHKKSPPKKFQTKKTAKKAPTPKKAVKTANFGKKTTKKAAGKKAGAESPSAIVSAKELKSIEAKLRVAENAVRSLSSVVADLQIDLSVLSLDFHRLLIAHSFEIDPCEFPQKRLMPIRVYLSDSTPEDVDRVSEQIECVLEYVGFEFADDFPAQHGSIFKGWIAKSREFLSKRDFVGRLEKVEEAATLAYLEKPQAETDALKAQAIKGLIEAIANEQSAAIQCGSILIVKALIDGVSSIQVRTLTTRELMFLERHQDMLTRPSSLLHELQRGACPTISDNAARTLPSTSSRNSIPPAAGPENS